MDNDKTEAFKTILKDLGGFGDKLDLVDVVIFGFESTAMVMFAMGMRRTTTWLRRNLSTLLRG